MVCERGIEEVGRERAGDVGGDDEEGSNSPQTLSRKVAS